ncbi:hypothetical protein PPYR_00843 [Photinus pyralis]|uniref:RFX-type winged-helix domain-containing protein n=1 Tax=Photinus pyralis TaxID=7054 RepID=A0A1Y1KXE6_PHOPY|nr:uncharacterized protein LOC116180648 isoform X2 [Photinus pyralis]KAB0803873.1 hypothetical protein PPYR_00843 [Photinus pyralis]
MNNENCDSTGRRERDDNITLAPEKVQSSELEIEKQNHLGVEELNKLTKVNNVDLSDLETNAFIANGVTEEAKKDLLESIVDVLDDVMKSGIETDDFTDIEKQVESVIEALEKNDCGDSIAVDIDANLPESCNDEITTKESESAIGSEGVQINSFDSLQGLTSCDGEVVQTSEQQISTDDQDKGALTCEQSQTTGKDGQTLEQLQIANDDKICEKNNGETIASDKNIGNCSMDDKTNESQQISECEIAEVPSEVPSKDVNAVEEKRSLGKSPTLTSILEATLTMGKKPDSLKNIANGVLNIPFNVPNNLDESSLEIGDDELDLLTPMVTVEEFCLQQDSLCNLVSASIESTLNLDSVEKGDQDESLIQHLILAEPGVTSFITIEEFFKQVKQLTSTEYLLLFALVQLKCFNIEPLTSVDIKRKSKVNSNAAHNEKVQKIAKKCLSTKSVEKVERMVEVIPSLTPSEVLFLHSTLPKVYKVIKDALQKTTICCRPVVSQTVMWLKTHYVEAPTMLISKPEVFRSYNLFCAKNGVKPCGVPDFGKMIKRTFVNIFHRRQVLRGKTQYFYCGLRPCYKLPVPKPPKLDDKTLVMDVAYSSSKCCTIYAYMHNLKFRMKPVKVHVPGSEMQAKKVNRTVNKENGKSKGQQPVVVHDPLELLSLSMDNGDGLQTLNDHTYVQVKQSAPIVKSVATVKSAPAVIAKKIAKKQAVKEYKNIKILGKSRSRGRVVKVKYKQYRHPSIRNIMDTYKDVLLSHDLFRINMNPVVRLENERLHNWCTEKIKNFIDNLSDLSIAKVSDNYMLKIKHKCCNTSVKVNQVFGEKLKDLKKELDNLKITHDSRTDNYSITYLFSPAQLPLLSDSNSQKSVCAISKKLGPIPNSSYDRPGRIKTQYFPTIRNKHQSVDKLFRTIDSLTVPEEIINADIDPVIVLDSQEVIDWYTTQLDKLKKPSDQESEEIEILGDDDEPISPRESRAKMMNFCESDSWDSTDVLTNDSVGEVHLQNSNNNNSTEDCSPKETEKRRSDLELEGPLRKKSFHLSDIINDSENGVVTNVARKDNDAMLPDSESAKLCCFFCSQEFKTPKELSNHCEIHLRCRTCKRRMPNEDAMRMHLIKHCFMNNALCAPNLILSRVDQPGLVQTYPPPLTPIVPNLLPNVLSTGKKKTVRRRSINSSNYPTSVLNFNNINHNIDQLVLPIVPTSLVNDNHGRKARSSQLAAKSQKSANILRFTRPGTGEVSHFQITANNFKEIPDGQTVQQPTSQLKNTISNNFNRILLLSNNSPNQLESPNIVYGLYLNNRIDQSTPIALNRYNRIGPDCALNTNPNCGISESTNFMQIVETPNVPLPHYESTIITDNSMAPFEEHQDHSYYQQQPVFTMNSDVSNLSGALLNGVSQETIHTNSIFEMPYLNNINAETRVCPEPLGVTPKLENPLPPPGPGAFRIRVKDIRELS